VNCIKIETGTTFAHDSRFIPNCFRISSYRYYGETLTLTRIAPDFIQHFKLLSLNPSIQPAQINGDIVFVLQADFQTASIAKRDSFATSFYHPVSLLLAQPEVRSLVFCSLRNFNCTCKQMQSFNPCLTAMNFKV
jgi:hypothetical protein